MKRAEHVWCLFWSSRILKVVSACVTSVFIVASALFQLNGRRFRAALCDFLIDRLAMYVMIHRFTQRFPWPSHEQATD